MYINALTALWNAIGTTYSAIKMDVTDGNSAADSKLLDLRVNTVPKFTVDKSGNVVAAGTIAGASGPVAGTTVAATTTVTAGTNVVAGTAVLPDVDNGATLGTTSLQWTSLHMASGGVINFANSDVTLTHATDTLTMTGGTLAVVNLKFPSTFAGSADVNTLDEYEEGFFSPTIYGNLTGGTPTYTANRYGRYTRVGRAVHFTIAVGWTAHTGTGSMQVGGLPFAEGNHSNVAVAMHAINIVLQADSVVFARIPQLQTYIDFYSMINTTGNSGAVDLDVSGSNTILVSGTYFV
jgi:hypothetical protein